MLVPPSLYSEDNVCSLPYGNRKPLTPETSTDEQWREQYMAYCLRQRSRQLRAAECRVDVFNAALGLNYSSAVMLSPADWGGTRRNVMRTGISRY